MISIKVVNDMTGSPEKGNYKYEVAILERMDGRTYPVIIDKGRVEGHDRRESWTKLLQRIIDDAAPINKLKRVLENIDGKSTDNNQK